MQSGTAVRSPGAPPRPAVIVSLDVLDRTQETVVVCPLTTSLHPAWRTRLPVRCGGRVAEVAVDQIRTVGKARLGGRIDMLREGEAAALRSTLVEMDGA